jgi:hypothetical protein
MIVENNMNNDSPFLARIQQSLSPFFYTKKIIKVSFLNLKELKFYKLCYL